MKILPISGGQQVLLDDGDFEALSKFRWTAQKRKHTFHAARYEGKKYVYMHRLLVSAGPGEQVDHKDGNGLNNQRDNLRVATRAQNQMGYRHDCVQRGSRGVYWHKAAKKWMARLVHNQKGVYLGLFNNKADAQQAYNEASQRLFGDFAQRNFR